MSGGDALPRQESAGEAWKAAHDALAAHGRARIAQRPEQELRALWDAYCLALCDATNPRIRGGQEGGQANG